MAAVATTLLLAQPFLTLRLVSRLRSVPRWLQAAALTGWALSAVPVVAWPPPLPQQANWLAVITFLTVELVAAWLLGVEARRRGGTRVYGLVRRGGLLPCSA